jgi:hypothetical protein
MARRYGQLPCVFRHLSQEDLAYCAAVFRAGRGSDREHFQRRTSEGGQVFVDSRLGG